MAETVLLRCSLVLGEVSSYVVSKIITGPQSTESLVLGEKPVLPFKMEQSTSSNKPGLPWEKTKEYSMAFCLLLQSKELFCTSGSATEGKGFYFVLEALEALHLLCHCPSTVIVTQWWGKQECSGIQEQPLSLLYPCYALQVSVLELCCEQRWSTFWGGTSSSGGHNDNCTRAESICRHHGFNSLSLKGLQFAIESDLCWLNGFLSRINEE